MMRNFAMALCGMCLAACGGPEGGTADVPSAFNPFATGHTCRAPALSGSAEQKACYAEAQKRCPEGQSPSQIEFEETSDGQFLIKGYRCA